VTREITSMKIHVRHIDIFRIDIDLSTLSF